MIYMGDEVGTGRSIETILSTRLYLVEELFASLPVYGSLKTNYERQDKHDQDMAGTECEIELRRESTEKHILNATARTKDARVIILFFRYEHTIAQVYADTHIHKQTSLGQKSVGEQHPKYDTSQHVFSTMFETRAEPSQRQNYQP